MTKINDGGPDANGWMPVPGWGGRYEAHPTGKIRTVDGAVPVGEINRPDGYVCVRLTGGGQRSLVRLHRLIALVFIPNPENHSIVNHIDHNPRNNAASNLEWCTQRQNIAHARFFGRMADDYWRGRRSPNASLSDEQVRMCRFLRTRGASFATIAKAVGTNKKTVFRIIHGETYSHVS